MSIHVIKAAPKIYTARCGKCGCTFSYEIGDVSANYIKGGEGVCCPSCGAWHRHSAPHLRGWR